MPVEDTLRSHWEPHGAKRHRTKGSGTEGTVKTITSLALYVIFGSILVSAQTTLTACDFDKLISRVKLTPASQLNPSLPPMTFEEWLRLQAGEDGGIAWAVRTGDEPGSGLPWVEADVAVQGHPGIVIMIACGTIDGAIATKPGFHSLELVRAHESAEWPHLRDLPVALQRVRAGAR
jgi:hypothetical protein